MSLQLKTYHASSVETAMNLARKELGPDAMLVHSQRSGNLQRHLGDYEVVFARPGKTVAPEESQFLKTARLEAPLASRAVSLESELAELKQVVKTLYRFSMDATPMASPSDTDAQSLAAADLLNSGFDRPIVQKLIQGWQKNVEWATVEGELGVQSRESGVRGSFPEYLVRQLQSICLSNMDSQQAHTQVVALAGPAGAGKTTTLAKLAVRLGLAQRRPVKFLCMDVERIGAAEQLRCYAAIMGAGFQVVHSPAELPAAVKDNRDKALLLIDTPGYGPAEQNSIGFLAEVFARVPGLQSHLVLPATMRNSDLARTVELFSPMKPDYLLFTRLDETPAWGGIAHEALRTGKRLSYWSSGQSVPEHLEPSSAEALVGHLLPSAFYSNAVHV